MHSDLKASNVLLDAGWTVAKLGDVGVAKCMADNDNAPASGWTLAYAAPELLISNDFDKSVRCAAEASAGDRGCDSRCLRLMYHDVPFNVLKPGFQVHCRMLLISSKSPAGMMICLRYVKDGALLCGSLGKYRRAISS